MTPSGQLSIKEFDELELEHEHDPPAFTKAREMRALESQAHIMENETKLLAAADPKNSGTAGTMITAEASTALVLAQTKKKQSKKYVESVQLYTELQRDMHANSPTTTSPTTTTSPSPSKPSSVELLETEGNLSDEDDGALDGMLLSKDEVARKTAIWNEMNKEFLRDEATKVRDGPSASSSSKKRGSSAMSAAEATKNMLSTKNISSKINYDALSFHSKRAKGNASDAKRQKTASQPNPVSSARRVHSRAMVVANGRMVLSSTKVVANTKTGGFTPKNVKPGGVTPRNVSTKRLGSFDAKEPGPTQPKLVEPVQHDSGEEGGPVLDTVPSAEAQADLDDEGEYDEYDDFDYDADGYGEDDYGEEV
jgi:hypothetical protein